MKKKTLITVVTIVCLILFYKESNWFRNYVYVGFKYNYFLHMFLVVMIAIYFNGKKLMKDLFNTEDNLEVANYHIQRLKTCLDILEKEFKKSNMYLKTNPYKGKTMMNIYDYIDYLEDKKRFENNENNQQ